MSVVGLELETNSNNQYGHVAGLEIQDRVAGGCFGWGEVWLFNGGNRVILRLKGGD